MVCAEDVILWFKDAAAYKRIDVMCSLLNMCIPFELRYLGTCIEELGKHDYQELRGAAITANDIEKLAKELNSSKGILDTTTRHRLTIYLSLLQSHNYRCANLLYSSIFRNEQLDVLLPTVLKDMNLHAELLLVYTMALNHPAFTFDQKTYFGDIVSRLNELTEMPQQTPNLSFPPGLGFYKPPLPVHHMPLVLKASPTHTEIPGIPGIPVPVNTVPNEFLSPPPPQMWPRPAHRYINTSCPPPPPPLPPPPISEMPALPPPVSPLVSQTSSPSQSRSVSPSRVYNVRQPQPPLQHIQPQIIDRIPPIISKDNVISNPAFQTEYKTISSDEVELGEKIPWLDPINLTQTTHIKIPNGMLCNPQHCQQKPISANYLANELQQLQLDETLQCLSSSASSQSSDTQSPPDTPTDNQQPTIPPHGPGRGLKQSNGGVVPPPGLPLPQQQQEIYPNCSVPYTTQYPQAIAPFGNSNVPVTQTKATCYNCGLGGHLGPDCKESTIEEITQKRGYQIDYRTLPSDSSTINVSSNNSTTTNLLPESSNTNLQ